MSDLNWEKLKKLFPELDEIPSSISKLQAHAELLTKNNTRVRAVASTDKNMFRHYAEALEMLRHVGHEQSGPICDVGSGGGFPGIIWAIMKPDCEVHLIESNLKKASLLTEAKEQINLGNIEVHATRAETVGRGKLREKCTLVGVRAVGKLATVLEYTAPLTQLGGLIIAPKGTLVQSEITAAKEAIDILGCEIISLHKIRPAISKSITIVKIRKIRSTTKRFPRRPGLAKKRPVHNT